MTKPQEVTTLQRPFGPGAGQRKSRLAHRIMVSSVLWGALCGSSALVQAKPNREVPSGQTSASNVAQAEPSPAPVGRRRPPQMPTAFDLETVTRLLESVEQPPNATVLKDRYLLSDDEPARRLPFPDWAKAIEAADLSKEFIPLLEAALADKEIPESYEMSRLAAWLYHSVDPKQELQRLQEAKPLLPRSDIVKVADFYNALTALLVQQEQLDEAVAAQRERVKLLNTGYARLLDI